MGLFGSSKQKTDLEERPAVAMTVKEAVADLRNEIEQRNEAIRGKIQGLQQEAANEKAQLDQLINDLIAQEAAGNTKGQAETEKLLAQLRGRQENFKSQIEIFTASLADKDFIRPGVKAIFELAKTIRQERAATDERKTAEIQNLEQQLLEIRQKLIQLHGSARESSMANERDHQEIASLQPFIERRLVEHPIIYLEAFANGAAPGILERYVEKTAPETPPPQRTFGGVVTVPKQPGQIGETRDLCTGQHTNSGFIAQQ